MSRTCKLLLFAFIVILGFMIAHKSSINNRISSRDRVSSKFSIPSQFADSQGANSLVYTDGEGNLILSDNPIISLNSVDKPTDMDVGENKNKSYIFNDNDSKTLAIVSYTVIKLSREPHAG